MTHQYPNQAKPRIPSDILQKYASVMTGKQSKHLTRPFADVKFIALRQWLKEMAGITKDTHPNFFRLLDARINLSEVENIGNVSEQTKLNLHISDSLKDQNSRIEDRRPLFALAPESFSRQ